MGKWLYTALYTIYSQLGNYAFVNGKPTIDWAGGNPPTIPPCTVSKTIGTGLSSTGGDSDVAFGDPLEVTIAITNNLYVVDDDSVVVTMGGQPVAGAWNASTMKVNIAAVTGNVVINVPSMTYVGYGEQNSPLKSMFDGMNVDWDNHEWVDKMDNSRVLKMNPNMTAPASGDHVEFDAVEDSTYAVAESTSAMVNVSDTVGTIEAVIKGITCNSTSGNTGRLFLRQTKYIENGTRKPLICANIMYSSLFNNGIGIGCLQTGESNRDYPNVWLTGKSAITPSEFLCFSVSNTRAYLGGQTPALTRASGGGATIYTGTNDYITLGVMSWLKEAGDFSTAHKGSTAGSAYCVRVYGRALEESEVLHNYKIDKKRFNLA